ncbi:uncharacterized protein LOC131319879 [Rhododendron vialii]|uniref:uncharacterized protein LOC131319879 n=1 Tax=Rhododendron vialii TaxID=182163 RepID=UPI00265E1464|nr:uncharacterized protein LOC131319879 [Rhododendron vialii]
MEGGREGGREINTHRHRQLPPPPLDSPPATNPPALRPSPVSVHPILSSYLYCCRHASTPTSRRRHRFHPNSNSCLPIPVPSIDHEIVWVESPAAAGAGGSETSGLWVGEWRGSEGRWGASMGVGEEGGERTKFGFLVFLFFFFQLLMWVHPATLVVMDWILISWFVDSLNKFINRIF